MESKNTCIIKSLLWGAGVILLIAAALDVLPMADNQVIFLAVACFILGAVIKRIAKDTGSTSGGSCCK